MEGDFPFASAHLKSFIGFKIYIGFIGLVTVMLMVVMVVMLVQQAKVVTRTNESPNLVPPNCHPTLGEQQTIQFAQPAFGSLVSAAKRKNNSGVIQVVLDNTAKRGSIKSSHKGEGMGKRDKYR